MKNIKAAEELKQKMNRIFAEMKTNPATPSAELQHFLDFKAKRDAMRAAGEIETPSAMVQATQYARAELTHATQGPASEADAAARLAICMGCEHRAVEYKGMKDENGVGWCTRCGCGSSPRALLWPVKLKMASVECPLGKFKAVSGTGATLASAVDAVAGVTQSIIHKLTGA